MKNMMQSSVPTASFGKKKPLKSITDDALNKNRRQSVDPEKPRPNPRSHYKLPLSEKVENVDHSTKCTHSDCKDSRPACFLSNTQSWSNWVCSSVDEAVSPLFQQKTDQKKKRILCALCGLTVKNKGQWNDHCNTKHHQKTFSLLLQMKKMHRRNVPTFDLVREKANMCEAQFTSSVSLQQKRALYNDFFTRVGNANNEGTISSVFRGIILRSSILNPSCESLSPENNEKKPNKLKSSENECASHDHAIQQDILENEEDIQKPDIESDNKIVVEDFVPRTRAADKKNDNVTVTESTMKNEAVQSERSNCNAECITDNIVSSNESHENVPKVHQSNLFPCSPTIHSGDFNGTAGHLDAVKIQDPENKATCEETVISTCHQTIDSSELNCFSIDDDSENNVVKKDMNDGKYEVLGAENDGKNKCSPTIPEISIVSSEAINTPGTEPISKKSQGNVVNLARNYPGNDEANMKFDMDEAKNKEALSCIAALAFMTAF